MVLASAYMALAHGRDVMIAAIPKPNSDIPYVPEEVMVSICRFLRTKMGYACQAAWDSGAIGSYETAHRLPPGLERDTGKSTHAKEMLALISEYASASSEELNLNGYTWRVLSDVALYPKPTPDGTYIWLPDDRCNKLRSCMALAEDTRDI